MQYFERVTFSFSAGRDATSESIERTARTYCDVYFAGRSFTLCKVESRAVVSIGNDLYGYEVAVCAAGVQQ